MTKNNIQRVIAIVLVVAAVVMAIAGVIHLPQRTADSGKSILQTLRIRTLLDATGAGVVESYVDLAKEEARAAARIRAKETGEKVTTLTKEMVAAAEEEAREKYANFEIDYDAIDTTVLSEAVTDYAAKLEAYQNIVAEAEQAYIDANMEAARAKAEADRQAKIDAGIVVEDDDEVTVSLANFNSVIAICSELIPENIEAAIAVADRFAPLTTAKDEALAAMNAVIKEALPLLDDKAVKGFAAKIEEAVAAGDLSAVMADMAAANVTAKVKAAQKTAEELETPVEIDEAAEQLACVEKLTEVGFEAAALLYGEKLAAYTPVAQEAEQVYAETGMDKLIKAAPDMDIHIVPQLKEIADRMEQPLADADASFVQVGEALKGIYDVLDDDALATLKPAITNVVYQRGDDYTVQYDRYIAAGSGAALSNGFSAALIRYADDVLYGALALLVAAAVVLYYELLCKKLGIPRIIIGLFFILLCFMTLWFDLDLATLLSNTLVRMGMNAIMVLAMVPGIQCGISLNLGLPIGLVAGLIGGLVTIQLGVPGWLGFLLAIVVGCMIAAVAGWLYAQLLNRLKGEEMSVTTYVGFSIVSLMCIAWLVLPFTSLKLRWPMGTGLRNTIGLDSTNFKHILDNFLSFRIGSFEVPTGLLLFMALMCFLVWLFTRSKTGVAMTAVGNNPRFAEATGINVDKMRVVGTVLSTVLGAVGILVYSQSYGFMQLYTAPRQMGFIAASAILIGGASTSRCKISHVIIGTFLFQGVLTLGMPVANVLVPGSTISETLRILISNGIILYALTKSGGESRA